MKNKRSLLLVVLTVFLMALACSTQTPLAPTTTPTALEVITSTASPTLVEASATPTLEPPPYQYSVVLVPEGSSLAAYTAPGNTSSLAGGIPPDYSGLVPTGRVSTIGAETWVEIVLPGGGTGWVDRFNLTEYASPAEFCADARVPVLFTSFQAALNNNDGRLLTPIVSPVHGLTVEYLHGGTPRVYPVAEVGFVFGRLEIVDWGLGPASGLPVEGSFAEMVRPDLLTVFGATYETHCREITLGGASYSPDWPFIWQNVNYISVYKPGSPDQELDWMTWVVGIEYVDGAPYLFSLTRYNWEP
jgi:hypothetical protein